jgi:hypothetical protein
MLADFFTKPLQGSLFRKFRKVILGRKHIDSLKQSKPTPSQERVGRNILQEIMRNGAGGQNTDIRPQTPNQATYADYS